MTHPLVIAARSHLGTPWRHRGRIPGRRLDCVGHVVCACVKAGRPVKDREIYGREPEKDDLRGALAAEFGPALPKAQARAGDIGLFIGSRYPLHVGVIGDYYLGGLSLIHASNEPGVCKVVEHALAGQWLHRLIEVYRVKEFG